MLISLFLLVLLFAFWWVFFKVWFERLWACGTMMQTNGDFHGTGETPEYIRPRPSIFDPNEDSEFGPKGDPFPQPSIHLGGRDSVTGEVTDSSEVFSTTDPTQRAAIGDVAEVKKAIHRRVMSWVQSLVRRLGIWVGQRFGFFGRDRKKKFK